ncbi:uncharacterized protein B0H64DRAFT_367079 [Chaetomium fimeti]|uniref:Uncharacterized protein n=1 Tax=Chaetomium fimeti TaxID=1854472 RepID=A0AAE0H8I7_9PEZI|nr:hypothetical protein B0H64DRAFT_367079 [Chaetomium fimeti]
MSPSPEPEQPVMSLDEYITLCADLHNTLLIKSRPAGSPPPETSNDLLQRYESFRADGPFDTYDPYIPPSLDPLSPLASLLSQLKITTPPQMLDGTPLSPLLYQPMPHCLFPPLYSNELIEADPPFVLLYPQRLPSDAESADDGGLFVDIYDLRGIWLSDPPLPGRLPPSDQWLPLDSLLKLELSRWESGRYVHDPTAEDGLKVQKWVPVPPTTTGTTTTIPFPNRQVAEAIFEWERLLSAIESRLPSPPTPSNEQAPPTPKDRAPPFPPETLQDLHISTFAQHFLTHARRPQGWTFVAPGISTFPSLASLHETYAAEPNTTFRRTFESSSEGHDWITLLLPCVTTTPDGGGTPTPIQVPDPATLARHPDPDINTFDKPHGFGKATVNRHAGLHTSWANERDGDLVQLVCPSGRTDVGTVFDGRCPWGPDRLPRLAEVLGHWAGLVEEGVWTVGGDGVVEDGGWWEGNGDMARLGWDGVVE